MKFVKSMEKYLVLFVEKIACLSHLLLLILSLWITPKRMHVLPGPIRFEQSKDRHKAAMTRS